MSIDEFPFPLVADSYRYSTNIEPSANTWLDIDDFYHADLHQRTQILADDPTRSQCLPHMEIAGWDALVTALRHLADVHPTTMSLTQAGDQWHWENGLLGTSRTFTFGDPTSMVEPLTFLSGQIQEDVVLLDQREDQLWADAGVVTFAAGWSLGFDIGMSFLDIHAPVPRLREEGIISRAETLLKRLEPGEKFRRTNWSLNVGGILDASTETSDQWKPLRDSITEEPGDLAGDRIFLRVEVQNLVRLAHSGAIMFTIRTHMRSLRDVGSVPEWRRRLHRVLTELPADIAEYKGLTNVRGPACAFLDQS